jgi:hypothetical protein
MADWQKIRAEYITTDISYRKLAEKYGLDQATIARKAKKEDWVSKRQHHADKTQAKILDADTKNKADRVGRLMTVADKLLDKVEKFVDASEYVSPTSAKNLSDTLKNIKEVCMVRTQEDIQEQKARIAKLQKETEKQDNDKSSITITLEGSLSDYAQ